MLHVHVQYPPSKCKEQREEDKLEKLCEQITLEEFRHAIDQADADDQALVDILRNRYGISTSFISHTLRKVSTTHKLKYLGHILRLNSLLPVDSFLRADNDQILILLHKTVTSGLMDAFCILLPHIQNPHHHRTKMELQSLSVVAAQVGRVSAVKLLCLNYPFCLEQTKHGRSVFVQVARASSCDKTFCLAAILRDFVEMGVYVNTQEPDGCTALHVAIKRNDQEAVQFLLEEGACSMLPDGQGRTPLDMAEGAPMKALLKKVQSPPSPKEVSLYHAAEEGDQQLVEKLLLSVPIDSKWVHGKTALAAAASVGNYKMVDHLLGLGASPIPLGCYWPDLPAMFAMSSGHVEVSHKLMQRTEDYLSDLAGPVERSHIKMQLVSLLHYCCRVGATGVANMVLNSCLKINPNTEFRYHLAPIHMAAKHGHLSTIKVLLDHRSDPTLPTEVYRNTPLHYACFYGHSHIAEFLLTLDPVKINSMNIGHETSLFCVLKCQLTPHEKNNFVREESVCCLLRHSARLVKPGRRNCELQEFNMEMASQRWNFLPLQTQKLLVVFREEKQQPPCLAKKSRLAIREAMQCPINEDSVSNLGLPYRLQNYVLLKDWFP